MSKPKFDVGETAKKFLSGVPAQPVIPEQPEQQQKAAAPAKAKENKQSKDYIPESREIGVNRPKSVDKNTGEVTKQIGYFVTESQERTLKELALKMNTNKSALLREAIRMYFDYLEKEGIL